MDREARGEDLKGVSARERGQEIQNEKRAVRACCKIFGWSSREMCVPRECSVSYHLVRRHRSMAIAVLIENAKTDSRVIVRPRSDHLCDFVSQAETRGDEEITSEFQ